MRHEPLRLDLLRGLGQVLGEERATTLMSYLPSTPEVASHEDIRLLQRRMDERFAVLLQRLDERFEQVDRRFEQVDRRFEQMDQQFNERFAQMDQQFNERIESVRGTVNERYTALGYQIRGGDETTASALHQELNRLMTSQTRIILFGFFGALLANISLVVFTT